MATDQPSWSPHANESAGIVLADGQPVVLRGLESILSEEGAFRVVETCANGEDTLHAVCRHRPDILLLDLNLPGKDGLTVLADIADAGLPIKSVIFTASIDDGRMCRAIRLGVLLKGMEQQLILQCLRKVQAGGEWLERRAVGLALEKLLRHDEEHQRLAHSLGRRELGVARLVAKGLLKQDGCRFVEHQRGIGKNLSAPHLRKVRRTQPRGPHLGTQQPGIALTAESLDTVELRTQESSPRQGMPGSMDREGARRCSGKTLPSLFLSLNFRRYRLVATVVAGNGQEPYSGLHKLLSTKVDTAFVHLR